MKTTADKIAVIRLASKMYEAGRKAARRHYLKTQPHAEGDAYTRSWGSCSPSSQEAYCAMARWLIKRIKAKGQP